MSTDVELRWLSSWITFGIGSILGSIITITHSIKVYTHLSTPDKTTATTAHKKSRLLLSCTILLSLYCYTIPMIIIAATRFLDYCVIVMSITVWGYYLSKMFMYLAFIIRLYIVYNNPMYHYNVTFLKIGAISVISCSLFLCISTSYTSKAYTLYGNKPYIILCKPGLSPFTTIGAGIYDIIFGIGSMIAFINPLRKLIKPALNMDISTEQRETLNELIHIGTKCFILSTVTACSTLLFMLLLVMELSLFAPLDYVTNMICMVLMTMFYNDKLYFERLCCVAIKCSDRCLNHCYGYSKDNVELSTIVNDPTHKPQQSIVECE